MQEKDLAVQGKNLAQQEKITRLAAQVWKLTRDSVMVNLRFLSVAVSKLSLKEQKGLDAVATDGTQIFYDPVYVLRIYKQEPNRMLRLYLHLLLHCIFAHSFSYDRLDQEIWDLAADIAVEQAVLQLGLYQGALEQDTEAQAKLKVLREDIGVLTAERIYNYFRHDPPTARAREEYRTFFCFDDHRYWRRQEELVISQQEWQKISERVKADLKIFSKGKTGNGGDTESIERNLSEATRERYDYDGLLRRFMVLGEELRLSEEEFDYVYYTYGLSTYGDMPLVEPLEYRDSKKIKDFVIALDTSASCRGELVRAFLKKTYGILKSEESFFRKMNLHILQCDSQVRQDTRIASQEDFDLFLQSGKLTGFGSTDFRPVFSYVDELLLQGEFENLKGLIYFTDGYGIYPEHMPAYDVIFAFLNEDEQTPSLPPWAIRVVLSEEELEGQPK